MHIDFHRITLDDKDRILGYTLNSPYRTCDFSFGNLYNWGFYYKTEVGFHKDMMIIRFQSGEGDRPAYLTPIGDGPIEEVLMDMEEDFRSKGYPLMIMGVTDEGLKHIQRTFPNNLHILTNRDYSDYVYLREKLVSLSGKKLQSKRNHLNKFRKTYPNYTYEEMTSDHIDEYIALENLWFNSSSRTSDITAERNMVIKAIKEKEQIGLTGGCIRVDGKIIAISMGMPITHDTFGVHIEKADISYDGSFAIINQEFVKHIPAQYTYINREEDLGIEGLRKAKLSYKPTILLDRHTVLLHYE